MSMTVDRARRTAGIAGLIFVVLAFVALILPGSPPKADELSKVSGYLADKRSSILAGNFMLGLAFAFFLMFAGGLRTYLGSLDRNALRPGALLLAGAATAVALILAGASVFNGAAFQSTGNDAVNIALYNVGNALFFMSGFGFVAFFWGAALAIATTKGLPSWLVPSAMFLAVLNAVGGVGLFAKSGFLATGGALGFIIPVLSLLWVIAASVSLLRGGAAAEASA